MALIVSFSPPAALSGEGFRERRIVESQDRRKQIIKSIVTLVVAAVALYLLLPSLIAVFSSWRSLENLDWPFAVLVLLLEVASSICLWEVDRIALGSKPWFPVAAAQL